MLFICRLLAVARLFRIILDVTSPAFNLEGRQWRSSIIEVFYRYFFALWADEKARFSRPQLTKARTTEGNRRKKSDS
jgi:hypothetical protein